MVGKENSRSTAEGSRPKFKDLITPPHRYSFQRLFQFTNLFAPHRLYNKLDQHFERPFWKILKLELTWMWGQVLTLQLTSYVTLGKIHLSEVQFLSQSLTIFVRITFCNCCKAFNAKFDNYYLVNANLTPKQDNEPVNKDILVAMTSPVSPRL